MVALTVNDVWIVVHTCVRVVLAARRVDITLPRHCLALISGVPHFAPRLAPDCGICGDDHHSAVLDQPSFLGHLLRRLWCQLGPIDAPHACFFATCWCARSGVPRILGWVGDVVHGIERVGCIVVRWCGSEGVINEKRRIWLSQ